MPNPALRWVALSVFALASTLNYLDRQLLAAVAPDVIKEFELTEAQYGLIISVFSAVYAFGAPFAGRFIDRFGLNIAASISVGLWSLASVITGFATSFRGLLGARAFLGISEAAGIPGFGKANALYLYPRELALGTAINQVGISLGSIAAPKIVAWLAPVYGWRSAFVVCGLLGFVWVPVWLWISRLIPITNDPGKPKNPEHSSSAEPTSFLRDRRVWGLVIATMLIMTLYTFWTNWTTNYFVFGRGLTPEHANSAFAWIPPVFATLGGFFGGWLAFYRIRRSGDVRRARLQVCWLGAAITLTTALVPLAPTDAWAAGLISLSYFWALVVTTNLYVLPIDLFGPARAAFGLAILTFSYGVLQMFVSPIIGWLARNSGYGAVCLLFAPLPLLGVAVLQWTSKPR